MFSLIIPGRPCVTDPAPIQTNPNEPPTSFAFTFPCAPRFSHLVIFLLPTVALPPGTAASVYIQFPRPTPQPNGNQSAANAAAAEAVPSDFRFLGAIANEKPSAVFKIRFPTHHLSEQEEEDDMMDVGAPDELPLPLPPDAPITVGIAVEPVAVVAPKLQQLQLQQAQARAQRQGQDQQQQKAPLGSGQELVRATARPSPVSTKVLAQRIIGNAFNFLASFAAADPRMQGQEVVPLRSFRDWWSKFERRIDADPGFLERDSS